MRFKYEGTIRRTYKVYDGTLRDSMIFSMLKEEYEEQYNKEKAPQSLCDGGDFAALSVFYGQILSGIILSLLDGAGKWGRHEVVSKTEKPFLMETEFAVLKKNCCLDENGRQGFFQEIEKCFYIEKTLRNENNRRIFC